MSEIEFKKFKEELKPIFRGYKKVNASMKKKLMNMGFTFIRQNNHYILEKEIDGKNLDSKLIRPREISAVELRL